MTAEPGTHCYHTRVRYADTDQMGIAHHARYYEWFESARTDLIRAIGISYRDLEKKGFMLPVLETGCRYIHPVHYDDLLAIYPTLVFHTRLKLKISYRLFVEGDLTLRSEGFTLHCFMNDQGRPVRVSPEIHQLFARLSGKD
ncbi:acyl-CoA thioesterase [bacterium]|nr:acyl-CoA thioesterase [bacterium]